MASPPRKTLVFRKPGPVIPDPIDTPPSTKRQRRSLTYVTYPVPLNTSIPEVKEMLKVFGPFQIKIEFDPPAEVPACLTHTDLIEFICPAPQSKPIIDRVAESGKNSTTSRDASISYRPSHSQIITDQWETTARKLLKEQLPPATKLSSSCGTGLNPYFLGLFADPQEKDPLKKRYIHHCTCDDDPKDWTADIIDSIRDYSFLVDCNDLKIEREYIFATNKTHSITFYNVPMVEGHPWKKKAEQVMRFIDVELDRGDQTAFDLFFYRQPCDRKIFLAIQSGHVIALIVAEKQLTAHRIQKQTLCYHMLEELPVPVKVGISRLWVDASFRRRRLATVLCDFVRQLFYSGEHLKKDDVAFSSAFSAAGYAFAKLYLKTYRVPIYKGKSGIKI